MLFISLSGVLWAGSQVIDRAVETANFFKQQGKSIFYVTNNSTKTRAQYLVKLTSLGFNAEEVSLLLYCSIYQPIQMIHLLFTDRDCNIRFSCRFPPPIHWFSEKDLPHWFPWLC